jgi:hypothetical protein
MMLHLDPKHIVWNRFGCLEPPLQNWTEAVTFWEDYTTAFFRSNGIPYAPHESNVKECIQETDRASFVKMAEVLLARLADVTVLRDVELVLLAHWLPDFHLGTSVTNFAMHYLNLEGAFGFAISARGLSAPLFALECMHRYLRDGKRKGLLMVMDQKHLLHKSRVKDSMRPDNNGCVMVLERRHGAGLAYLGYRRVMSCPESLSENVAGMLHSLCLRVNVTTIITADRALASVSLPGRTVIADEHLVCAAPFVALSEVVEPDRDYLLVTRDDHCLYGVGFRSSGM